MAPDRLRILIASSPRMGNTWMRHLLAHLYDLPPLHVRFAGTGLQPEEIAFPEEDCVCHEHFFPHPNVLELARRESLHLITMLRHPADAFYSLYRYCNQRAEQYRDRADVAPIVGVPFSHERVYENLPRLLEAWILARMIAWRDVGWADENEPVQAGSGQAIPVRYEDLLLDTEATLLRLTRQIRPVSTEAIRDAIDFCRIDRMRSMSAELAAVCRKGQVNQWKDAFDARHVELMQQFAEPMRELGYSLARPALEEQEIASLRRRLAVAAEELARKEAELAALRAGDAPDIGREPTGGSGPRAADALNRGAE